MFRHIPHETGDIRPAFRDSATAQVLGPGSSKSDISGAFRACGLSIPVDDSDGASSGAFYRLAHLLHFDMAELRRDGCALTLHVAIVPISIQCHHKDWLELYEPCLTDGSRDRLFEAVPERNETVREAAIRGLDALGFAIGSDYHLELCPASAEARPADPADRLFPAFGALGQVTYRYPVLCFLEPHRYRETLALRRDGHAVTCLWRPAVDRHRR
ncbi:MAG: hypothetical protein KGI69_00940 [Patescibacteria group bacterium]|nr:hypothetical protein [Patescibacteria group bacterium]